VVVAADLQARGNPDEEDADVDGSDEDGGRDHDVARASAVGYDDADAVDDDLEEELDLDAPPEDYGWSVQCRVSVLMYELTNAEVETEACKRVSIASVNDGGLGSLGFMIFRRCK
jgi:hypothetical protein